MRYNYTNIPKDNNVVEMNNQQSKLFATKRRQTTKQTSSKRIQFCETIILIIEFRSNATFPVLQKLMPK